MELIRGSKKSLESHKLSIPKLVKALDELQIYKKDFLVLEGGSGNFVQAIRWNKTQYMVEYRDAATESLFQVDEIDLDGLMEIFISFYENYNDWKNTFNWLDVTPFIGLMGEEEILIPPFSYKKEKKKTKDKKKRKK